MIDLLKRLLGGGQPPEEYSDVRFPFETRVVRGAHAPCQRIGLLGRSGLTPVIMGDRDDVRLLEDGIADSGESVQEILAKAARFDVDHWMRRRAEDEPERFATAPGPWPDEEVEPMALSLHRNVLTQRAKRHVILGLVPTGNAWEVPAHLRYGGWNECPPPEMHVALHRKWHGEFGATIACMSGDTLECVVERPPASREQALALAREQFAYCPDIVDQGLESVERLAATLMRSPVWFFWWD